MKRPVSFAEVFWLLFTYYTITHFNWWLISISFLSCPKWKQLRDWYDVQVEWKKREKQIDKDLEDEINQITTD